MTTRTAQGLDNTCQPHQSSKPVQYYDAVESKHQHRPDTEFGESNNDDDDDDFMMRIVHGSCQGVFPADGCHLPTCHIADQLDLLMHCRQPLSFLTFFHGHGTDGGVGVDALPAGAYMMPTGCEYCGGPDARLCTVECQRPAFYFQKKRPPFCKSDELLWNPLNDHAIPPKPKSLIASLPRSTHLPFEGSWVSGLFGRNSNGVSSPTRT